MSITNELESGDTLLAHATSSNHWLGRIGQSFRQAIQSYLVRRAVKAAEAQLMGLDDRLLSDIGIHRSEIKSVLRDTAHERKNAVCFPSATMV